MIASSGPDVPILVETPGRQFFRMVRCHYLAIEYSDPQPGWEIRPVGIAAPLPVLMLELIGIVYQPLSGGRFTSHTLIEELFEQLEDKAGLLINFEDIWLPEFLFEREVAAGEVYRVGHELFRQAYLFREGHLAREHFGEDFKKFRDTLVFSEEETAAFTMWSDKEVFRAQQSPPKNAELRLPVRGDLRGRH
jgi:hypothetical protein